MNNPTDGGWSDFVVLYRIKGTEGHIHETQIVLQKYLFARKGMDVRSRCLSKPSHHPPLLVLPCLHTAVCSVLLQCTMLCCLLLDARHSLIGAVLDRRRAQNIQFLGTPGLCTSQVFCRDAPKVRPECDATTEEDRLLQMIKQLRSENAELKPPVARPPTPSSAGIPSSRR